MLADCADSDDLMVTLSTLVGTRQREVFQLSGAFLELASLLGEELAQASARMAEGAFMDFTIREIE